MGWKDVNFWEEGHGMHGFSINLLFLASSLDFTSPEPLFLNETESLIGKQLSISLDQIWSLEVSQL